MVKCTRGLRNAKSVQKLQTLVVIQGTDAVVQVQVTTVPAVVLKSSQPNIAQLLI